MGKRTSLSPAGRGRGEGAQGWKSIFGRRTPSPQPSPPRGEGVQRPECRYSLDDPLLGLAPVDLPVDPGAEIEAEGAHAGRRARSFAADDPRGGRAAGAAFPI